MKRSRTSIEPNGSWRFLGSRSNLVNAQPFRQRGYVMVLSMLILLLITIMSISMGKSFFMEEGMAGNTREKNRSLAAAQAALLYGEWWAKQNFSQGVDCSTMGSVLATGTGVICNWNSTNVVTYNTAPTGTAGSMPLAKYFTIPTVSYITTSGTDSFYAAPGAYVQYIGYMTVSGPPQLLYRVTAFGYGGNANSFSVVQSTVAVASTTQCLATGSIGSC